ncbi:Fc.00g080600.m01.CDS01 [Cosmosporella sp. VM-42]
MPTVNAIRAFEPPPMPPFAEFEQRRSSASTLTGSDSASTTVRCMSTSSTRSKASVRPKSAKFSSYRLRSNSGLSLHTNEDILRQYTDYYPDGTPRVALYGNGNGNWPGERLRSIDSIASSQRSSIAFTDSDTSTDLPIPDFVGREMFDLVMKDPVASGQLWKFAASRGVGQNVDYLMKIRDYAQSLEQVVVQLSAISTTYTSITATSPINLPNQMSKSLNMNIKHLTSTLIPSLENMFMESKTYVEQRIVREIFPAFVKQQLSICTSLALSTDVEGDCQTTDFPGLGSSFCLSDPSKNGNPIVFASDEFEELTGYTRFEVLSRNCRFMQGPQTDREAISRIRSALWRREECMELLLNFRRDGQPFWNLLRLVPLVDGSGKPKFFMGAQIDVSSCVENYEDVIKMLSYGSSEEQKGQPRNTASWAASPDPFQTEMDQDDPEEAKQNVPLKVPKKSFFKPFKKLPPPPLSPPLSPRRSNERPRSSTGGPNLEKSYSTRSVLKRLSAQAEMMVTPYSRYMVLEHAPSYPASLASMPLDQEMRYPPKLSISYCSQAIVEILDLGLTTDEILGKDVFDVLAEQATLPSVTKAFKSTVRDMVVRDGKSITLDLALANHIPKRANMARSTSSDETNGKKSTKMISHWTPMKDADDLVRFVVLIISPL